MAGIRKIYKMRRGTEDAPVHTQVDKPVAIDDASTLTEGHFQKTNKIMSIPAGEAGAVEEHTFSYPYPVSILSADWLIGTENHNDEVCFVVGEDTVIGSITVAADVGDTVLNVSSTVPAVIRIGGYIKIDSEMCYRCTAIDATAGTITVEQPLQEAKAVNDLVKMTVAPVCKYYLYCSKASEIRTEKIGLSKWGGSDIPANTIMKIKYTNNGTAAKNFVFGYELEY